MSTSSKISQISKNKNQDSEPVVISEDDKNTVPSNKQDEIKTISISQISSATIRKDGSDPGEENRDDDILHEIFKISSSKELKYSENETSSEALETVGTLEFSEREKLEEELQRVDFMIRNRKQSLFELEAYRSNHSLMESHPSKGSIKNSSTSVTFSSSCCDSDCERESMLLKDSKQNFLSNLRHIMPSFHLIRDIDQRLVQLNINTSPNSLDDDRAQCDLVLQALDVLTKQGIKPSALSSPYPLTEYLFKVNNN